MTDREQTRRDAKPYPKSQQLKRGTRRYWRKIAGPKQWQAIISEKTGPCRICSDPQRTQFHHVLPRDVGGADTYDNIIPLCQYHHGLVTDRNANVCRLLVQRLTDAEYAYAVTTAGENVWERVYGVEYER